MGESYWCFTTKDIPRIMPSYLSEHPVYIDTLEIFTEHIYETEDCSPNRFIEFLVGIAHGHLYCGNSREAHDLQFLYFSGVASNNSPPILKANLRDDFLLKYQHELEKELADCKGLFLQQMGRLGVEVDSLYL